MRHALILIGLVSLLSGQGLMSAAHAAPAHAAGQASEDAKTRRARLQADGRLDAAVTVEETGIPLRELLSKLSRPGLRLRADASCAEQKVQARIKRRPLRAVLFALAEWLPGYWDPSEADSGYTLVLSGVARRRRDNWWVMFLAEREKAFATVRAAVLDAMRAEPQVEKGGPGGEVLSRPDARARDDQEFFRRLPSQVQAQIAQQLVNAHCLGIPGVGFGSRDEEGAISLPFRDLPEAAQERLERCVTHKPSFPLETLADSVLYMTNGGFVVYATARSPKDTYAATLNVPWAAETLPLQLDHTALTQVVHQSKGRCPEAWKRLADYHESRVWPNTLPADSGVNGPAPLRRDVLERLGRVAAMEFVSDYHSKPGLLLTAEEKKSALQRPLEEELNRLAVQTDLSWKRRGEGIYLLRSNRWYRDDAIEVPAPLLTRWLDARVRTYKEVGGASGPVGGWNMTHMKPLLDLHADFVSSLTNWQLVCGLAGYVPLNAKHPEVRVIRGGDAPSLFSGPPRLSSEMAAPFGFDVQVILSQYRTTQFYASLNDEARRALLEQRLPFAALTVPQRESVLYLLPQIRERLLRTPLAPLNVGLRPKAEGVPLDPPVVPQALRLVVTSPQEG